MEGDGGGEDRRKRRRERSLLCECVSDSSNPSALKGQVCFCWAKLAVTTTTTDGPSHMAALSYFS